MQIIFSSLYRDVRLRRLVADVKRAVDYASPRDFVDNGRDRSYDDIRHELDESLIASLRRSGVYKQQEFEADYIGIILGARAGFYPVAMLSMLRKFDAGSAGLGLHPGRDERIGRVENMLPMARRVREIELSGG